MRERSYSYGKEMAFPATLRNGAKKMKMRWSGSTREVTFIYSVLTIKYGMVMDSWAVMGSHGPFQY